MADGYGAGLFDETGPKNFATEVGKISSALTGVQSAFTSFGSTASNSLSAVSNAIDELLGKLSQVSSQLSNLTTTVGGGGAQGTGNIPAPQQQGPQAGSQWATGAAPQPNAQTGTADSMAGMPQGTAGQGGWVSRTWNRMTQGTAGQENAQYGGSQPQGGQGGMQGTTMGQRAIQSMIPAAVGAVGGYAGGMVATAVQGATIGQMYGPAFGVNPRSLYTIPAGILANNPQDYAQSNYIAMMQGGVAPGGQNWSTIMGPNGGLNQMMTLSPGLQRQQAAQTYFGQMMAPQTLNSALAFGYNFSPGGRMESPQQQYQQVWQRLTRMTGGKPTGKQVEEWLRPGGPWSSNLAAIGWAPGSEPYNEFVTYALTQVGQTNQGKTMPRNLGSQAGASQTPLGQTPAYAQLQRDTAQSRLESQAEPALAQAAKFLNEAATKLMNLAQGPASFIGGIPGLGTAGGIVGGVGQLGMTGLGLWGAAKFGKSMFGKGASMLKGLFGGGGGAAGEGEAAVSKGLLSRAGGGILSKLGGLFGGGGGEAAGIAGAEGGMEAAGLGLDATGIGAPVGLALGAAGLALPFIAPHIGGIAKGIGHAVGGIGHDIGSFFGGLFGGDGGSSPKKAAAPTGSPTDVASLLSSTPPRNSLLACLTQPIPRGANTLASALLYSPGGAGGAGPAGAGAGMTAATASTNTMTPGSAWTYRSNNVGAVDLSGLFRRSSTSSTSGNNAGGGTPSPISGNIPAGGDYNQQSWAQALLQALNAPTSAANTQSIVNWENREGGNWHNSAKYNPLNTTYKMPGSTSMNGVGVQAYTSWQQGLEATVNTLKSSDYNDIVSALQAGQGLSGGTYKGLSTWSGGGYSSLARGTQLVARTQLALLHRGEAVVPAADNYSSGTYGQPSSGGTVHLNFKPGSVVLQVPPNTTQQDMENLASQFVAAISKPQVIAGVRST